MIIPTDDRLKIWRTLFSEGVMIAAKDTRATHSDTKIRNLFVSIVFFKKQLDEFKNFGLSNTSLNLNFSLISLFF